MNLQTRLALTSPCASPDTESLPRADSACQGKGSEVVPHEGGGWQQAGEQTECAVFAASCACCSLRQLQGEYN